MAIITNILYGSRTLDNRASRILFLARLAIGAAFMSHGWQKLMQFDDLAQSFPDPLGIGSQASLILALFAELACPVGFIFGFLYRLALIPMITTMAVAFFAIHGADPFAVRELAFLYLVVFILLWITGPGRYSIDSLIKKAIDKKSHNSTTFTGLNYSR